jgi:hypothetical protein
LSYRIVVASESNGEGAARDWMREVRMSFALNFK